MAPGVVQTLAKIWVLGISNKAAANNTVYSRQFCFDVFTKGFNMNKTVIKLGLLMGSLAIGNAAAAATATGTLSVSASIAANCVFAATNATLPFGTLTVTDLANGKTEVTPALVKITCTNSGTAAKLYGATTREMTSGANVVAYEVYTDSGHATALGSTALTGADVVADGTEKTITLYGKTTAGQGAKPIGSYAQALALTVDF